MGGFNNNPYVAQFKSALRKLLVKQQVSSSAASNCADSDISGAIFELKWSKRTSPMDDQRFECLESEPTLTMAADVAFSACRITLSTTLVAMSCDGLFTKHPGSNVLN